jgi:hypothetical protein
MRLRGLASSAEQSERRLERVPAAVSVTPGLQDQARGFRLETPLPFAHESQVFDCMLVQHVLPPFRVSTTQEAEIVMRNAHAT